MRSAQAVKHEVSVGFIYITNTVDELGFEALCVATWRSVGIPARLNNQRRAECFSGSEWCSISPPESDE
jgi:hypothetical protein